MPPARCAPSGSTATRKSSAWNSPPPAKLRVCASPPIDASLSADGQDLAFITVESIDAQGRLQPNGNQTVTFKVEGAGTLAGVASGDYSHDGKLSNQPAAAFQRTGATDCADRQRPRGTITVTADAPGLKGASVTLETNASR